MTNINHGNEKFLLEELILISFWDEETGRFSLGVSEFSKNSEFSWRMRQEDTNLEMVEVSETIYDGMKPSGEAAPRHRMTLNQVVDFLMGVTQHPEKYRGKIVVLDGFVFTKVGDDNSNRGSQKEYALFISEGDGNAEFELCAIGVGVPMFGRHAGKELVRVAMRPKNLGHMVEFDQPF